MFFLISIFLRRNTMKKSDFYYDLPKELIAQTPIEPRDHSRMMVLSRKTNSIEHKYFYDFVDYLSPGDCLILNNTRVLPARMYGVKKDTGAKIDIEEDGTIYIFAADQESGDAARAAIPEPGMLIFDVDANL